VTQDGDYWAVIPVHDEAPTIREVALRTLRVLPQVIVVDDGSCDGTAEALAGLPVVLLRNRRNRGKAMSLWRGARGVVTLDGDGQHAPEDITGLLAAARRMPGQLLIGARSRHARRRAPPGGRVRYYANRFADFWISWAAGYPIVDSQSGLRFYPRELLGKVKVRHGKTRSFVFESEVLTGRARDTDVRVNYFGISDYYRPIPEIDSWIRRRIRMCYWKQWRWVRTKVRNLLALGTSKRQAILTAISSKSYWHLSKTLATRTGMTNDWLKSQGLISVRALWMRAHGYT